MTAREHHIVVSRTARYFALGEPDDNVADVWFVCHGYGQLARYFLRHFEEIAGAGRLVVAPEALSRFYLNESGRRAGAAARIGATWMTREDRLSDINDYVAFLDAVYAHTLERLDRSRVKVTALGFSQGVATISRWITRGKMKADRIIAWAGSLPPELDLSAFRKTLGESDLVMVVGRDDEAGNLSLVEAEQERLREAGIPFRLITFDGGHRLDAAVIHQLAADR